MRDNILLTYALVDILFLVSGVLLLAFALTTQSMGHQTPTVTTAARDIILKQAAPVSATIGNAVLVFITFLISIAAMVMPMTRGWLKLNGYMTAVCALFTMILGLSMWVDTLRTRSNLSVVWADQPASTQSLIQQALKCCGYANSTSPPFVVDSQCPSAVEAATQIGCVGPFSTYANNFLDPIFTGAFGIVGVDVALILAITMVVKDRAEKERYRHIDEKNGAGAI